MPAQAAAAERKTAHEPETVLRREGLRRALNDPATLEEFLINPTETAKRYEITLNDEEMAGVRQASHFLASWDQFCGRGKWLDSVLSDRVTDRWNGGEAVTDLVVQTVRSRIAEEILWEIPVAIRRVMDNIGPDALTDRETEAEIPASARPLVRSLRSLTRNVARQVNHEISGLSVHAGLARFAALQPQQGAVPQAQAIPGSTPDGATGQFAGALAMYLTDAVNRAVEEAVQRMAPLTHESFRRQAAQPVIEPARERN